ncbi:hypothetical protein Tco_1526464, partial [Tanacetum coccineum]
MAEDGKLKIDIMMVMISVSERCRSKTLYIRRSFRSLWQKPNLQCSKLVASRDKMVNMAAGDSDDALVCWVENTVEDRIMIFRCIVPCYLLQRRVIKVQATLRWILKDVRNKTISSENDLRKSMLGHSLKLGTRNK